MKRMALTFVVMAVLVVVSAGATMAAVKIGTNGVDEIFGTSGSDVLYGRGCWEDAAVAAMWDPDGHEGFTGRVIDGRVVAADLIQTHEEEES